MGSKLFHFKPEAHVAPCPTCSNAKDFYLVSEQVAEDGCEVFLRCVCGTQPQGDYALEDVWGELSPENAIAAKAEWNEWRKKALAVAGTAAVETSNG